MDVKKQKCEREVLSQALSAKISARNRDNLISVLGECARWDDDWVSTDRPDFYRVFPDKVVGLEHFAIDKHSEYVKGSYEQFSKSLLSTGESVRKKWSSLIDSCDIRVPLGELTGHVYDILMRQQAVGDKNMIPNLFASLNKHIESCNAKGGYRDKLTAISNGKPVEIGCLIELTGDFSDVILFEFGEIRQNLSGLIPLSHIFMMAFSFALHNGFDFVIFYRKRTSLPFGNIVADKTMVITKASDLEDVRGYFQGEPVYGRIPASQFRDLKLSASYAVRHDDVSQSVDSVQNVHVGGRGIDLRVYWPFAWIALDMWKHGRFCYCDLEFAATVYALDKVHALWDEVVSDDSSGSVDRWFAPYGFDERMFKQYRIDFLRRHRLPGVLSLTLSQLYGTPFDLSDDVWMRFDSLKDMRKFGTKYRQTCAK